MNNILDTNKEILNDFLRHLKESNISKCTVKCYHEGMTLYFRFSNEISRQSFKLFIEHLENKGFKSQTIAVRINAWNKFAKFLCREDLKLKPPKIPRRLNLEHVPSKDDYDKLLTYLKRKNIEQYFWVRLLASTGARISEFLQFTWEHVGSGAIDLKGKGNKYRRFFFPPKLSEEMTEYAKKNLKTGIVVVNKYGKPMRDRCFSLLLKAWARQCGLDTRKIYPHAFRHFFAKQYLKSNNDIVQLADLLGHEDLKTTRIYLQKTCEEQKQDYNRVVTW